MAIIHKDGNIVLKIIHLLIETKAKKVLPFEITFLEIPYFSVD